MTEQVLNMGVGLDLDAGPAGSGGLGPFLLLDEYMGKPLVGLEGVGPELDRRPAASLVFDALTAVIPSPRGEELDEGQELYADLGMDSKTRGPTDSRSRRLCVVELL